MFRHSLMAVALLLPAFTVCSAEWEPARTASSGQNPTAALPAAPAPAQPATQPTAPAPQAGNDITAPLRQSPPPPSPSEAEAWAKGQVAPLSRNELESVHEAIDEGARGRAWEAADVVPRISTQTVNLSPGGSLPVVRTAINQGSTVMFTDNTGAPWPISVPPYNSNEKGFSVTFIPESSLMTVQALRQYDKGNITVYLKGLAVPVIINAMSGEPDNGSTSRIIDSRLDLRIPQRGPAARVMPSGQAKIDLNNPTLQAFLDGVPPASAKRLKTQGDVPSMQVWQMGDDLYVRTRSELRDQFELTQASGDGTILYKLPLAPELAFSVAGKTVWLGISLE